MHFRFLPRLLVYHFSVNCHKVRETTNFDFFSGLRSPKVMINASALRDYSSWGVPSSNLPTQDSKFCRVDASWFVILKNSSYLVLLSDHLNLPDLPTWHDEGNTTPLPICEMYVFLEPEYQYCLLFTSYRAENSKINLRIVNYFHCVPIAETF